MINFKDTYAKVWQTEDKGNYIKGRISTSEKDRRNEGKYINSNWFCKFVGKAKDGASTLSDGSRIKILSGKISNTMNEEKKSYLDVVIFDFEVSGQPQVQTPPQNNSGDDGFYPVGNDELPF